MHQRGIDLPAEQAHALKGILAQKAAEQPELGTEVATMHAHAVSVLGEMIKDCEARAAAQIATPSAGPSMEPEPKVGGSTKEPVSKLGFGPSQKELECTAQAPAP